MKTRTTILFLFPSLLLLSCGESTPTLTEVQNESTSTESDTDSFRMRNAEIRQDIINALIAEGIEHWENDDGSTGFYSRDTERVDAIGFFAISAYAARQ